MAATADTETASHDWTTADLLALFDTAVDPPGLDVGGWVCAAADRAVLVAWRAWESGEPAEDEPDAGRDELCPVPLAELARVLDGRAWLRDPGDGLWRRAVAADLAPGVTVLLDAARGGYLPGRGWAPDSTAPVPVLGPGPEAVQLYGCGAWVSLDQHLRETEEEARRLADALPGLPRAHQEAVILAARYHDLGKCHDAFQEMLRSGGGEAPDILLAKSMAPFSTGRHTRTGFRHELVSALLLADDGHWHGGLDGTGTDHRLVIYLAAAHHGRVRMSVPPQGEDVPGVLGVLDGDRTPPVVLSSGETFPAQVLQTDGFRPGVGGPWSEQARALRDRDDLGPFRLAYLETLVRVSDWLSSARHDVPVAAAEPTAERPAAEPEAEPSAESAAT